MHHSYEVNVKSIGPNYKDWIDRVKKNIENAQTKEYGICIKIDKSWKNHPEYQVNAKEIYSSVYKPITCFPIM